jgi:hypothetical protein
VGAKHWVGGDSCVWGLIWGFSERFTGPRLPSSADEHHRRTPHIPGLGGRLKSGSASATPPESLNKTPKWRRAMAGEPSS